MSGERAEVRAVGPFMGRRAAGVVAAAVLLACIGLASPQKALATATFSSANPSNNTTVPGAPLYVSVYADDTSMILDTTSMTVNGVPVPVTLDYPGYWADPDCEEVWVVSDWTAATISTPRSVFTSEGAYTVEVTVRTQSSGTTVYSWSFVIDWPPGSAATFWSMSPAQGTTITAAAQLKSWVGSPNSLGYSIKYYLDGVPQSTSLTPGGGGSMYAVTPFLAPWDGTRTVRLGVMDNTGVYTEKVWTFGVAIKPTLSAPTPYGGASYSGVRPQIGLTIADNTPGQVHLRMVVDGAEVFNGMTDQGAFRWTPTSDLTSGENHAVSATVTDGAGNVSSLSWEFNDGVMFASTSPSQNTTVTGSPGQVSVFLDAASVILDSARIWVDGVPKPASVVWVGHIEDPDCEAIYVVDDWTAATISAPSGVLLEGSHTVHVEVDTQGEGTVSYTWSFVIAYVPGSQATFSNRAPAPGSIITTYPQLKVSVMSPTAVYRSNISVYVDGTKVPSTTTFYHSTNQNVTVDSAYITSRDGTHTVLVNVLNDFGVVSQDTWQFQTQIAPTLVGQYPTTTAPAHTPRPQIGVLVGDNAPGQLRLRFRLDGVTRFDGQVDQGFFKWTPTSDFANNSTHSVVVDVWDAHGNTKNLSWSFNVIAAPAMSDAGSCTACHPGYPGAHPFTNCGGCHAYDPLYDEHESNRYAPLGPCYDCHGSSYNHPAASVSDCVWCHTSEVWTQIPRHETSPATAHESTTPGCTPCHDTNLVTEHAKYPSGSDFKNQCASCHVTQVDKVNAAIADHDTACIACHGGADPHHVLADVSEVAPPSGPQCSTCHSSGITWEHFKPTSSSFSTSCDSCHAVGGARDQISGAWDQTCDTAGCHDAAGERPVHANYCLACHDVAQADFSVAKTSFPSVTDVDRDVACKACHLPGFVGAHPYHQAGAVCGAVCHPGWGGSLLTATPVYSDPVSGAAFATEDSKDTTAGILHAIHSEARWPAGVDTDFSACASCHAVVACNACHTGPIPVEHKVHSSVGSTDYPAVEPWEGVTGRGVVDGDQTMHTDVPSTVQCSVAGCHDLDATVATRPRTVEDYNYGVGGNPADLTGTNAAISTVGTWRVRFHALYSGGRMSYANASTASLTASFTGSRVEVISDRDPYRGQAEVLIDGEVAGTFDAYAPTTGAQTIVFAADVEPGPHTITVRPTGTRSVAARGAFVVVDAFRVYASVPASNKPACTGCHGDRGVTHW